MIQRRGYGSLPFDKLHMNQPHTTSKGYVIHPGKQFLYESLRIKKKHGSVLVAICFVTHHYPIVRIQTRKHSKHSIS
jgi:hypothetical protein